MLVGEADAGPGELVRRTVGNWVLTILATGLTYEGGCTYNHDFDSQGNFDYNAHAQVYVGGADPLGSQGYASVIRHPSSS